MKFNQTVALVTLVAGSLLAGSTLRAQETPATPPAAKTPGANPAPQGGMRAAMNPDIWPHVLALGWQGLCVVLFVRGGARLFRARVMKSGPQGARKGFSLRRAKS